MITGKQMWVEGVHSRVASDGGLPISIKVERAFAAELEMVALAKRVGGGPQRADFMIRDGYVSETACEGPMKEFLVRRGKKFIRVQMDEPIDPATAACFYCAIRILVLAIHEIAMSAIASALRSSFYANAVIGWNDRARRFARIIEPKIYPVEGLEMIAAPVAQRNIQVSRR